MQTILDSILFEMEWTPYGIQCQNKSQFNLVHKFMREAVLDRHIFVSKVIGVGVSTGESMKQAAGKTYIARHGSLGESYPELTVTLQDKIFMIKDTAKLSVNLENGENTLPSATFISKGKEVECLYANPEICRALRPGVILSLQTAYNCGYRSMADNSKALVSQKSSSYFPCNTNFSLAQFVRVLPPMDGNQVIIRVYNGMTLDKFREILINWKEKLDSGVIPKEEKEWIASFGQ